VLTLNLRGVYLLDQLDSD